MGHTFSYVKENNLSRVMRKPALCICCTARFLSKLVGNPKTGFLASRLIYDLYVKLEDFSLPPSRHELFSLLDHFRTQGALKVDTIMNA